MQHLTIDFYEPEWHNHRIVCQCYVKNMPALADDAYIEKHIVLTELERYIAEVYHYTGQYYDSNLEEYFDKEDWDSVLYDLEVILNKGAVAEKQQDVAIMPLPDMPVIIKELIMVA